MSHDVVLHSGAFIIADAHYAPYRDDLEIFLSSLEKVERLPPQLFLFGDIFDFLVGESRYSRAVSKKLIDTINRISCKTAILYLEGNHDFNLKNIFPNVTIFDAKKQPIVIKFKNREIYASHGDRGENTLHEIYMRTITCKPLLRFLNLLDSNLLGDGIARRIYQYQQRKQLYSKIENFKRVAKKRIELYRRKGVERGVILEGHFHQGEVYSEDFSRYANIPSFACNQSFFVVESSEDDIRLISRRASDYS